MNLTIAIVVCAGLVFLLRLLVRRVGLTERLQSGLVYLLLGVAVGPLGGGVLSSTSLTGLQSLLSVVLGVQGFLIGLSIRDRVAGRWAGISLGVTLIVGTVVGGACAGTLLWLGRSGDTLPLALALAAMALACDPGTVEALARRVGQQGNRVVGVLLSVCRFSAVAAVLVLGVALALARGVGAGGLTRAEWALTSIGLGVGCGLLHWLFVGQRDDPDRTFLATGGVLIFASGLAAGMGMSALLVSAVAGVTVAIASPHAEELRETLWRLAQPTRIAILVAAGALFAPAGIGAWSVAVVWLGARLAAVLTAPDLAGADAIEEVSQHRLGRGLLGQGALTAAIALNYAQVFPEDAGLVIGAAALGLLTSDLTARRSAHRLLADVGGVEHEHLGPRADRTPAEGPGGREAPDAIPPTDPGTSVDPGTGGP